MNVSVLVNWLVFLIASITRSRVAFRTWFSLFRLRKGDEHSGARRVCSGVMEELKLRRTCCPEQQRLEIICSVYEGFMRETSDLQHVARPVRVKPRPHIHAT